MKHSLTALLLTLALFCCLLTGCGPTPDVPGGSEGSNGSSSGSTNAGTEPDDANGTNSARLQPSVSMTSVVQPGARESTYTANYRFTITNPNTAYSVNVRLGLTLTSAAGEKRTDFTFSPVIAPGDTVCFMYKKSYVGFHPTGCSLTSSTDYLTPEQVVRTSDLLILKPTETKNSKVDYNTFSGAVNNTSRYATKVKVSLFLKKNGHLVSVDAPTLLLSIPAGGTATYSILHYKDAAYDDYEVTATPWN